MVNKELQMCPLFPDMVCPQGEEASKECAIRVNGDFDPVHYFKDQLIMHCAIHQSKNSADKETLAK